MTDKSFGGATNVPGMEHFMLARVKEAGPEGLSMQSLIDACGPDARGTRRIGLNFIEAATVDADGFDVSEEFDRVFERVLPKLRVIGVPNHILLFSGGPHDNDPGVWIARLKR